MPGQTVVPGDVLRFARCVWPPDALTLLAVPAMVPASVPAGLIHGVRGGGGTGEEAACHATEDDTDRLLE